MNTELTNYSRKETWKPSNDYEVIMDKISRVRTALSPLRFLLVNYKSIGSAETDDNDLNCLGTILEEQIELLNEAHEIVELMPKPKKEYLH